MLREGRFPLVITREERDAYIEGLRSADDGDLAPLVKLFGSLQRRAVMQALDLSEEVQKSEVAVKDALNSAAKIIAARKQEIEQRHANVVVLGDALHAIAAQRLDPLAVQVDGVAKQMDPDFVAYARNAASSDAEAGHYHWQIGQCAKALGYYANFTVYQAWAGLFIKMLSRTEIVFAFHGIGRNSSGVLACCGLACVKELAAPSDSSPTIGEIVPLASEPFILTYKDDLRTVRTVYERWLEDRVVAGLDFWKKQI